MIELRIEDYCHTCPYFDEDVEHTSLYGYNRPVLNETYIRCEHRRICDRIVNMMKEKNENPEVEKRHST